MIKAKHSNFADFIFKPYIYNLLKKNFFSINIIGDIPKVDDYIPLILAPNHSTWWDGFFVYLINKELYKRRFYIMILEEQLSKYNFFTKLGGFSINKLNPKEIIRSLDYISDEMKMYKNSIITIFPQGELLPNFVRPISINKGIHKLVNIHQSELQILPLAIKVEFLKEEKPTVFFKFGNLYKSEKYNSEMMLDLQTELEECLNSIEQSILSLDFGHELLLGKKSVSEKSKKAFAPINKVKRGFDK